MVNYYAFYELALESSNVYTEKISLFIVILGLVMIFILPVTLCGLEKMGMLFSAKTGNKSQYIHGNICYIRNYNFCLWNVLS